MFKKFAHPWRITRRLASAGLASLLLASGSHADVYKWIDAAGQTHYSERKADAKGANTTEVKIPPAPKLSQTSVPSADYLRAPSKFAPQPVSLDNMDRPALAKASPSASAGIDHGTDASRCALARDVLSGAVRHANGKPTDNYDREVAHTDLKMFCRSR